MDAVSVIVGIVIGGVLGATIAVVARRGGGGEQAIREHRDALLAERDSEQSRREQAERDLATLTERELQLQARFEEQRVSIEDMRKQLLETFDASSRKALQDNSERFMQQAAERMKPLREQLEKQEKLVTDLAKERQKGFGQIGETLKHVLDSHRLLSAETSKLTTALRRPDQRGRWGEVQLRRVVELAGMTEHCDFAEQQTVRSEDSYSRPDLTVFLPGGGRIAVDSKVPLDAYLDAVDDPSQREARRAAHADAVQQRWKELAKRSYWDKLEGSPELVVMFIPIESALMAALEYKPTMHADAMAEKVLIATPTLLVGLLRSIEFGWRQEALAKNAREIADVGKELYERLTAFAQHHGSLGKKLEAAVKSYNKSVGSMERRLLVSGKRLSELGVQGEAISDPTTINITPQLPASSVEISAIPDSSDADA
ncbi:MAG: DNA recombination protein RmuC [Planctomycetes bacterium]|jgi:DNA recombination protein RmuC|nr:DNA recombination protein RmuC [Planctomycetota bacterium]